MVNPFGKKAVMAANRRLGQKETYTGSVFGKKQAKQNLTRLGSDFKSGMLKYGLPVGAGLIGAGILGGLGAAATLPGTYSAVTGLAPSYAGGGSVANAAVPITGGQAPMWINPSYLSAASL